MKKIKILLLILSIGFTNALFASGFEEKPGTPSLIPAELFSFMKKHYISLQEELIADVKFTFNEQGEIVVLTIGCDKPEVREFVCNSLNNQKTYNTLYETGKTYRVPVRLKS